MADNAASVQAEALALKKKLALEKSFFKRGIFWALFSGMMYGLYSTFILLASQHGIWIDWANSIDQSTVLAIILLPTIAAGLNDFCSAVWALLNLARQGKLNDFWLSVKSKPGSIMILAALCGGPIANIAYVIALSQAGPIVTPISALCPVFGTVLSAILFKQKLGPRVIGGIVICVTAGALIGSAGLSLDMEGGNAVLGLALAFVAAIGWGVEGCVAGYGTSMIDSNIGIAIRQTTSGIMNLFVMPVVLSLAFGQSVATTINYAVQAFCDFPSLALFAVAGFFAFISFANWYRGNSMCGTALGMALNSAYSFWGPFFCWIIIGIILGVDGYGMPPIAWFAALLMVAGIAIIAIDPAELKKNKEVANG